MGDKLDLKGLVEENPVTNVEKNPSNVTLSLGNFKLSASAVSGHELEIGKQEYTR